MALRDRDSIRCVRPILATAALVIAALVASPVAHADPGTVVLRSGARVEGEVVAVVPGDHVIVVPPDMSAMTIAWADVTFVFDGPRLYDSAGNSTTVERPARVVPPASVVPAPSQPAVPMPRAVQPYAGQLAMSFAIDPRTGFPQRIPSLAGTRALFGVGGFFFVSGAALLITMATLTGSDSASSGLVALIFAPPALFGIGVGIGLVAPGARRMATRRRLLPNPRSPHLPYGRRIDFQIGVSVERDAIVPRLSMVF